MRICAICIRIYLLTPWSTVLLEKLTGFQPIKKFPAFYGTRMFITALTSARHLFFLYWASSIQSITRHPTPWRFIFMSSPSMPGSSKWFLSFRFPHRNPVYAYPLPCTRYRPRPSHSSRFYYPNNIGRRGMSAVHNCYSIYPRVNSILEAVPSSATWGRAMLWWHGPTYHGHTNTGTQNAYGNRSTQNA